SGAADESFSKQEGHCLHRRINGFELQHCAPSGAQRLPPVQIVAVFLYNMRPTTQQALPIIIPDALDILNAEEVVISNSMTSIELVANLMRHH
ncbi:hypothetical protein THAOC_21052, partial [Thalassiosira oceanica]